LVEQIEKLENEKGRIKRGGIMKRKITSIFVLLIFVGVFAAVVSSQVPNKPSLLPSTVIKSNLIPAHNLQPPFPYVYYYLGQSFVRHTTALKPWHKTFAGLPAWAVDREDTAFSNDFRFPKGADRGYLSVILLQDNPDDSCNMLFGFSTRNPNAKFAANYGTMGRGWQQAASIAKVSEDSQDSLKRTFVGFASGIGDEWRITCIGRNPSTKKHAGVVWDSTLVRDSVVVAACQVTFGFPGTQQYSVQIYPDPSVSDQKGGQTFNIKGAATGTDTSYTCKAPSFSTLTLFARPTYYQATNCSLEAYVALDARALQGLPDEKGWYPIDSVFLHTSADTVGEIVAVSGRTKAFFDQYRIRVHGATDNNASDTTAIKVYGLFSP
jgi:hypothetical protein